MLYVEGGELRKRLYMKILLSSGNLLDRDKRFETNRAFDYAEIILTELSYNKLKILKKKQFGIVFVRFYPRILRQISQD